MKATIENNMLRIPHTHTMSLLFKMAIKDGAQYIVYCVCDEDGEKGISHFIFTSLGKDLEEKREIIRQTLAYYKSYKLIDRVIKWFETGK